MVRCVLEWSVPDVCDWLDSLFMPEYKVSPCPNSLCYQLLVLSACPIFSCQSTRSLLLVRSACFSLCYQLLKALCFQHAHSFHARVQGLSFCYLHVSPHIPPPASLSPALSASLTLCYRYIVSMLRVKYQDSLHCALFSNWPFLVLM